MAEQYEQLQFPGMEDPTYLKNSNYVPPDHPFYGMTFDQVADSLMKDMIQLREVNALQEKTISLLTYQIDDLQRKVDEPPTRPGRKPKVMVEPDVVGVCGLYPDSDDTICPHANVYRYQQGCKGTACVAANTTYYAERRRIKEEG